MSQTGVQRENCHIGHLPADNVSACHHDHRIPAYTRSMWRQAAENILPLVSNSRDSYIFLSEIPSGEGLDGTGMGRLAAGLSWPLPTAAAPPTAAAGSGVDGATGGVDVGGGSGRLFRETRASDAPVPADVVDGAEGALSRGGAAAAAALEDARC